jgi:ubiquinone/menaquinone biosynthesis C-methylase UbiE
MLEQARKKIKQNNWENVEMIQSDMADYDAITEKASKGLSPDSGFSIFEL